MRSSTRLASMLLLVLAAAGCRLHTRTEPLAASRPAPAFELTDHDDKPFRLADQLKRGPAVLVFYRGYW